MLEGMLQYFRALGMDDLSFLVVNSKDFMSQLMRPHLKRRVTFPVYQETSNEEVWSVLNGGKDDMFVYDRCGVLSYYIPFPQSVITRNNPIIAAAIFSTYFGHPCNITCGNVMEDSVNYTTTTAENGDTVNDTATTAENGTDITEVITMTTEVEANYTITKTTSDYWELDNGTTTEVSDFSWEITSSENDTEIPLNQDTTTNWLIDNNSTNNYEFNTTEEEKYENVTYIYVHPLDGKTHVLYPQTTTPPSSKKSEVELMFETLFNFFSRSRNDNENKEVKDTDHSAESSSEEEFQDDKNQHHVCDKVQCKEWTKKQLQLASKCCKRFILDEPELYYKECRHFGKKQCKKAQVVLKCCPFKELEKPSFENSSNDDIESFETKKSSSKYSCEKSDPSCRPHMTKMHKMLKTSNKLKK
ncbi:uncharacterized protein LOC106468587 [Limulus polyphemus]|uniref:Uncharacterized protein LOC106468587 n=1 Tax=Limulus polyphemus TaxID=6850 RepID=A0ABM1BLL5_LIMPO|nr:uncharacterized protein LOC106468587 [Limulus polyphemus]XP_022252644.1 uncharacterized protein LOC106468587 [Limulus polyphemus]